MSTHDLSPWTHDHRFDAGSAAAERGTMAVLVITLLMMVTEIVAGWWLHSMALLADGWHMSSHALAIGLAAFSYRAARRQAHDTRFAFGTWKIEVLGSFASALLLLGVALVMLVESAARLAAPLPIRYGEAMVVAALGLLVNVVCAWILGKADHHTHAGHEHAHAHHHHAHADLNLRSAYVHVLADAATSILAIVALAGAWAWGWVWLDALMGILGAILIAIWARRLLADSGTVLLDREMDHPVVQEIREVIDTLNGGDGGDTHLADLHVWRVGRRAYACVMTLVTHDPTLTAARVREQLAIHEEIVHTTIEIHRCTH